MPPSSKEQIENMTKVPARITAAYPSSLGKGLMTVGIGPLLRGHVRPVQCLRGFSWDAASKDLIHRCAGQMLISWLHEATWHDALIPDGGKEYVAEMTATLPGKHDPPMPSRLDTIAMAFRSMWWWETAWISWRLLFPTLKVIFLLLLLPFFLAPFFR
jgi:hypothetical protein